MILSRRLILEGVAFLKRRNYGISGQGRFSIYSPIQHIPPYSPNLNLIGRFWKFVKGELRSKYYDNLEEAQARDRVRERKARTRRLIQKLYSKEALFSSQKRARLLTARRWLAAVAPSAVAALGNRFAREFVIAPPVELDRDAWTELLTEYVQRNFVAEGMCADVRVHDTDGHNPHGHIMLTLRPLGEQERQTSVRGELQQVRQKSEERTHCAEEMKNR